MAEKKFLKGSEEWLMFQDFWKLCQSVWIPEETDAYWEEFFSKAEQFVDRYKTDFARDLCLLLLNDLKRRD